MTKETYVTQEGEEIELTEEEFIEYPFNARLTKIEKKKKTKTKVKD